MKKMANYGSRVQTLGSLFKPKNARDNYRLNLQRSLTASLFIVLVLMFWARHIKIYNRFAITDVEAKLKFLQLENVTPRKDEPKQNLTRVLPPPKIVPEADVVPDKITTPIRPVPERRRRRRKIKNEKVQLDLLANTAVEVANRPNLDPFANTPRLDDHRGSQDGGPKIEAPIAVDEPKLALGTANLDISKKEPSLNRVVPKNEISLTIPEQAKPAQGRSEAEKQVIQDILKADVSLVLTSSNLNMGVEEYKIWNRINAEFDRWDKGRYGPLPKAFQRRGGFIVASFAFADGGEQHIVWRRGNTQIFVKGTFADAKTSELKKALNALIQLKLNGNR